MHSQPVSGRKTMLFSMVGALVVCMQGYPTSVQHLLKGLSSMWL
jgi:hypothetical protein